MDYMTHEKIQGNCIHASYTVNWFSFFSHTAAVLWTNENCM